MPSSDVRADRSEARLLRAVWTALVALLALPLLLWMALRALRQTGRPDATLDRLGLVARRHDRPLWFHAASVGEVQALLPLVRALRQAFPELPLQFTTFTAAGAARLRAALGAEAAVAAVPLDLPITARSFLARIRPRALVVIETELWPNLLLECTAAGLPFAFVSARLGERAAERLDFFQPFIAWALGPAHAVLAQSGADALRLRELGAPGARTRIVGNVKWDLAIDAAVPLAGLTLKREVLGGRAALVAGSTRDGEEPLVLEAFAALRATDPNLALVLAPRHPERADAVAADCAAAALECVRRSSGAVLGSAPVLLLDTLGELDRWYAAGEVAFVGGSLKPFGGHNLLEPAALGLPVLAGPHQDNAPEVAARLEEAGGLRIVRDATELAAAAGALLADPGESAAMGGRARGAVHANRGALEHCLREIQALVGT
jgi:3-deoxy-D-manno-octulosonic-acid transferase